MTTLTLKVRRPSGELEFEKTFGRLPFNIGRNPLQSECSINGDANVSQVHASVDIVEGRLRVRDANSTNGTFVRGARVLPGEWVDVGPAAEPQKFSLGRWTIEAVAASSASSTKTIIEAGPPESVARPSFVDSGPPAAGNEREATTGESTLISRAARVAELLARAHEEVSDFSRSLAQELRWASLEQRAEFLGALRDRHPELATDPRLGVFFPIPERERRGFDTEASAAALLALEDLARTYVDPVDVPSSASTLDAFRRKLAIALREFGAGYAPLAAGVRSLRAQLALGDAHRPEGRPAEASDILRELLDWRVPDDGAAVALRRSFRSLHQHEVALLQALFKGVKALIEELSPSALAGDDTPHGAGWLSSLGRWLSSPFQARTLWARYVTRHADLADEDGEVFRHLFGDEFAAEYRAFTRESSMRVGTPAPRQAHKALK